VEGDVRDVGDAGGEDDELDTALTTEPKRASRKEAVEPPDCLRRSVTLASS
jgi:hypothetical protein